MKFTNKKRGFTIVELIIVIAVIAVYLPQYLSPCSADLSNKVRTPKQK